MSRNSSYTLSISEASAKGVAAITHDAEAGAVVVLERRHEPVAAVIGLHRFESLIETERDLRDIGVVLTRAATDDGVRHTLSDVVARFGFDRGVLEDELDEDLATDSE
jgi:PHD/YefM family antitoxin component YafN of YafNO toxin-antitoxin module